MLETMGVAIVLKVTRFPICPYSIFLHSYPLLKADTMADMSPQITFQELDTSNIL